VRKARLESRSVPLGGRARAPRGRQAQAVAPAGPQSNHGQSMAGQLCSMGYSTMPVVCKAKVQSIGSSDWSLGCRLRAAGRHRPCCIRRHKRGTWSNSEGRPRKKKVLTAAALPQRNHKSHYRTAASAIDMPHAS